MSYDSDFENVYMVELASGRTINVMFFNVEEVKEHCRQHYPSDAIKTIYAEVYVADEESLNVHV
jgi:hypothetical protein